MKFFADENVARAIVQWLRDAGHDVCYAAEDKPGEVDTVWLQQSQAKERLLLTADKDFGALVFRDHLNSHGVVLLRMEELTIHERLVRLQTVWSIVEAHAIGKFMVITARRVRMRLLEG